jgi:hypothetical protein
MECIKCKKEIPDGAPYCCWCGKNSKQKRKSHETFAVSGLFPFCIGPSDWIRASGLLNPIQ